jgi:hypothetical protein
MTLIVENKNITKSFIPYLKKRLLGHVALLLDTNKLKKYDEYFKSEGFDNNYQVTINSKRVILLGLSNLQHKRYDTTTHIFINPNTQYPGTTYKIVDLCKMINFGTLSIEGYSIFSNTFEHFQKNINKYIDMARMGR